MTNKKVYVVLYDNGCGDPGGEFKTLQDALDACYGLEWNAEGNARLDNMWIYEAYELKCKDREAVAIKKAGFDQFLVVEDTNVTDISYANSYDTIDELNNVIRHPDIGIYAIEDCSFYQAKFIGKPTVMLNKNA